MIAVLTNLFIITAATPSLHGIMKQYVCLRAVDHEGNPLMWWYIEHVQEEWKLTCDAGSSSPRLLEPFETAHGRYEMVAVFMTPAMFEAVRDELPEFFSAHRISAAPSRAARHGFRPLTASQRESCHLKQMNLKDKEIDDRKGQSSGAAKQSFYRLRKDYSVNSTTELLQRLAALREI